jgi:cyclophilin family peptidyl-prolyl cis-trans isomerase
MKSIFTVLLSGLFLFSLAFAEEQKADPQKEGTPSKMDKKYEKRKADNPEIAIETDFGTMTLELFRDVAPIHVDSMLARIRAKFYDGLLFHRIIDGFMIQGGDPKGNGTGDAGYTLPAEFSKLPHVEGTLSMARAQDPNSASCQFFICLAPASFLDGKYSIFGHLMSGYETLHKIGKVAVGGPEKSKPVSPVYIRKMTVLTDKK